MPRLYNKVPQHCRIMPGPNERNASMTQTLNPKTASNEIEQVPLLCGGKWITRNSQRSGDVFNPSTGKVIAKVPFCSTDEVNSCVEAAAAAGPEWANKPVVQR